MVTIQPIGINDTVHVRGKHLYKRDGTPFVVKGIAFPTPPVDYLKDSHGYNATAWVGILQQLRDLDLDFNTVRLYRMYPQHVDYREFFEGAASLGVYVIVPLTSASGGGVLDRTLAAPKCYKKGLFRYGATAIVEYLKYPNALAGMVGNEVMNDEDAWQAAPCIRAYARDLKLFMDRMVDEKVTDRTLPLIYATQDASVIGGAEVDKNLVMKLTADYLTCAEEGKGTLVQDAAGDEPTYGFQHFEENKFGQSPVDIVGINVESWCSSTQDYFQNPDGTPGTYFSLYEALRNTSVPIIFTEMGCPHSHFDRDDLDRKTPEGTRDWAQVSIVLDNMADSWSGFVAYAYDGPTDFVMMSGGPYNGADTLTPTKDFYNFKKQLDKVAGNAVLVNDTDDDTLLPRRCSVVEADLLSCCDLRLFNDDMIQSFQNTVKVQANHIRAGEEDGHSGAGATFAFCVVLAALASYLIIQKGHKLLIQKKPYSESLHNGFDLTNGHTNGSKYGSI